MTTAERLRSEAFREGYAEGLAEGFAKRLAEVLVEVLTFRFGPLPPAAVEVVQAGLLDRLKAWTVDVVTAETLDDALR